MTNVVQIAEVEPIRIRIERGQRGSIGWEISIHGDNPESILEQIRNIDRKLMTEYGKPGEIKDREAATEAAVME